MLGFVHRVFSQASYGRVHEQAKSKTELATIMRQDAQN
jgi:hypothetical protein